MIIKEKLNAMAPLYKKYKVYWLSSLDDYILFYNTKRPHSNNNYKPPNAKEQEYFSQKETPCSE